MIEQADRLYTAEQVRRLDRCAIEGHGIPGIDLMERAGRAVFDAARHAFPEAQRYLVLCGAGNNGGDGYIVARLAREAGLQADVCALKPPDALAGDAALSAERWNDAGGSLQQWPLESLGDYDLVIDALLGTGLDREPSGSYAEAIEAANHSEAFVMAVDIPSGLHADTGRALGTTIIADMTVTFIGSKRGLFTADGPDHAGEVLFDDLETPDSVRVSESDSGILVQEEIILEKLPPRLMNSHKGSYGWLLVSGGDRGMSGAVRLCGEAALRGGAGKVTVVTREEHAALINVGCPELMVRGTGDTGDIGALLSSVDVIVTGTGLGQGDWSDQLLEACLLAGKPTVVDADGLNLMAQGSGRRGDAVDEHQWILTPHPAEAARLLGCSTREVQENRVGAAQEIASALGAIVVLKGCGSVIAHPAGRYAICPLGNPGMATAGSGDVLSGVIGALLAQGLEPWDAALTGVAAHAAAGDLAAGQFGQRGMLASDITAFLPAVLNPV
ncbi:MAG: NAD(P)H-hydrate dehydratase [Xanthomonadales bacterium]|nr:NAD(P)H-hydrate dehydratase [Gammaproteobacteria bacterium]NNL04046.1 NAD(P)H-hydrate dehydratase [Xanthomonadales bacterium]